MTNFKIILLSLVVGVTTSTAFSFWQTYKEVKKDEIKSEDSTVKYSDILKDREEEKKQERIKERVKNATVAPVETVVEKKEEKIVINVPEDIDTLKEIGDESDLRYDKNSLKAWQQYMNYLMSEFDEGSSIEFIMYKLFDIPFKPVDTDDQTIELRCLDSRSEFFGEDSVYVDLTAHPITLAEVVLDFAGRADFDFDRGIPFWAKEIINGLPISEATTVEELRNISKQIGDLNYRQDLHKYYVYGLFALVDDEMQNGTGESLCDQFSDWEQNIQANSDL